MDDMLRDMNLVPLSHQHQHALALCVEIERSLHSHDASLAFWQDRIQAAFDGEIELHFQAEEQILFPAAERYEHLTMLVSELLAEHTVLRSYRYSAMAFSMTSLDLLDFSRFLSGHIRKEERGLFEGVQLVMDADELGRIGKAFEDFFRTAGHPSSKSNSADFGG